MIRILLLLTNLLSFVSCEEDFYDIGGLITITVTDKKPRMDSIDSTEPGRVDVAYFRGIDTGIQIIVE